MWGNKLSMYLVLIDVRTDHGPLVAAHQGSIMVAPGLLSSFTYSHRLGVHRNGIFFDCVSKAYR